MRGPLGWAQSRGQNLQRLCANRSAQNCGEAPSPSVASLPPPLPARGERWEYTLVIASEAKQSSWRHGRFAPPFVRIGLYRIVIAEKS